MRAPPRRPPEPRHCHNEGVTIAYTYELPRDALTVDCVVFGLDEVQQDVARRAARSYRFDERKYRRLAQQGLNFEP